MHNGIHYEPILVVLSYVISVLGSYTALQLAIAIPQARGRLVALGGGAIWSMHFIAMNAADMGMPVSYDAKLTFASLVMGVLASAIGLYVVGRGEGSSGKLLMSGVVTGLGVALMHYTGMAAMLMPATIDYDPTLFYASLVIAVVAAAVALWLPVHTRGHLQRFRSRDGSDADAGDDRLRPDALLRLARDRRRGGRGGAVARVQPARQPAALRQRDRHGRRGLRHALHRHVRGEDDPGRGTRGDRHFAAARDPGSVRVHRFRGQIGRASCRERV